MKTRLIIEPHIHGAFGVDFNTASVGDILEVCKKLYSYRTGGIFPTLVTDTVENIKRQIDRIKLAREKQDKNSAKILGIHLEGIFLNPDKKGIHDANLFMPLTVDNYKKIEEDFIKIVTLAPELDEGLIEYLSEKGIKVQAGHCTSGDLSKCSGVTHLFNAMSGISHRGKSTALSALINDDLYTEIIADGVHLSDDTLKLVFKTKPASKIILVSDSLPVTHGNITETVFAGEKIFYDGEKAVSQNGTLAGSTMLIYDIVKRLIDNRMFNPQFIENAYNYFETEDIDGETTWD